MTVAAPAATELEALKTGLGWDKILPESGLVGIFGKQRMGKSGLMYYIAEMRWKMLRTPAVTCGPPASLQAKFPDWMTVIPFDEIHTLGDFRGYTCMIDEGSLPLHARNALGKNHLLFDEFMSFSGQRDQLLMVCTHHSTKLDINIVREWDVLAFKQPKKMYTLMERESVRAWVLRARDLLVTIPDKTERKKFTYVLYDDLDEETIAENPLPSFWCDEISIAMSMLGANEDRNIGEVYRFLNLINYHSFDSRKSPIDDALPQSIQLIEPFFKKGNVPDDDILDKCIELLKTYTADNIDRPGDISKAIRILTRLKAA